MKYQMSKKAAVLWMALAMVFSISVVAGAHGTMTVSGTRPRFSSASQIKADGSMSLQNVHERVEMIYILQRQVGTTWHQVGADTELELFSNGFSRTFTTTCPGLTVGNDQYRTKWEFSADGAHLKKITGASTQINASTCHDD